MLSGRETLDHLSATLRAAREELQRLDRELQSTSTATATNRQQQGRALKRMAAARLDAIRQGDLVKSIESADFKVRDILDRRQQAIAEINAQVSETAGALVALEERRDSLHEEVDAAAEKLAEREADAQSMLESNAEYQSQLERTHDADAVAVSAAEKAQVVVEDRREKERPYQDDPLFMYLWQRGYGTSAYRANPLARLLDAWVARLCHYQGARPNYWMLQEIPQRLKEHAERKRTDADRELDALQALEEVAARDSGALDAMSALENAEKRQDEIDARIAESEARRHELQTGQARYAAGDDTFIAECLGLFADTLQRRDVADLTHLARSTMTTEDDAIVDDLRALRREEDALQNELERNRALYQEHLRRVQELEQVRQRFKKNRYDDIRSGFDKGDMIVSMMREVLGGAIRGGALWEVLRQYQRYRNVAGAWPDFGSGGISRNSRRAPTRPPTWHWPGRSTSSHRGGFKIPRASRRPSRSRSRGGFRTGGSI